MIKTRIFTEHNYKGLYFNGRTLRIALDPTQQVSELAWPEFYDVKITSHCLGECSFCYQDSRLQKHDPDVLSKFINYFSKMTPNQKPFQIAFGGGEPTSHPDFCKIVEACHNLDIIPNYTTNGMWTNDSDDTKQNVLDATINFCEGVAVSTHPHLEKHWKGATNLYLDNGIFTNLHIIISDKQSIDTFMSIYKEYKGRIKYFVLLPLIAQGRCKDASIDWKYLIQQLPQECPDIAFGANFYPYLCKDPGRFPVSLYTPEIMSKYLDLETMKIYPSSFSNETVVLENLTWKKTT